MPTEPTLVAAGPAVPDSSVAAPTFDAQYEAFNTWEKDELQPGMNALAENVYDNALDAEAAAAAAAISESAAAASALAAGAVLWVSGTTYAIGDPVVAPLDLANVYVRRTAGAGTTDPSADPTNWTKRQVGAALVLLAAITPTVAANLDFLTTFSGAHDNYRIILDGLLPAADDALCMRVAVAGASDAGSNYYFGSAGLNLNAAVTLHQVSPTAISAGKGVSAYIEVLNANDAVRLKYVRSSGLAQTGAAPNHRFEEWGSAYVAANAISGFRLFWNSGSNFQATGKVRVYGYANN